MIIGGQKTINILRIELVTEPIIYITLDRRFVKLFRCGDEDWKEKERDTTDIILMLHKVCMNRKMRALTKQR